MFNAASFLETVPSQAGKLAVLTGGNSGIGLEACAILASKGAKVVFTARSQAKADEAKLEILSKAHEYNADFDAVTQNQQVIPTLLDLSDMQSVLTYRERFEQAMGGSAVAIDMLILNAGVMALTTREETKEGFEMQMATNCYGHYVLTCKLLDLLKKSSFQARIVSLSSIAHFFAPPFRGITLDDLDRKQSYSPSFVYNESKLGNLLFAKKLARLLQENGLGDKIVSVACHPGITKTPLFRGDSILSILGYFGQTVSLGTTPTILAATDVNAKQGDFAGPFLFNYVGTPSWNRLVSPHANDESLQDKFWEAMEQKTGVKMEFIARWKPRGM